MHHALYIEEILSSIFRYCHSWPPSKNQHSPYANSHLAALARTCGVFKEPALDLIWAELDDLTPLVRCLPSKSWKTCESTESGADPLYSFQKHLDQTDWDTLIGYARRVRALRLYGSFGLTEACIQALSNPLPFTFVQSLFPNLRVIGLHEPPSTAAPLIRHFINPTVTDISFKRTEILGSVINTIGKECPYVTNFRILEWAHSDTTSDLICRWQNLSFVRCYDVGLNVDTLLHLSRLRNLNHLSFKVHDAAVDQIQAAQPSSSILTFSALRGLYLNSPFLAPVGRLMYHVRASVLRNVSVGVQSHPTAPDLMLFFTGLQEACAHTSLNHIYLRAHHDNQSEILSMENSHPYYLTFNRLRPLTVFSDIKSIILDIPCGVDLNERDLLTLTSSWPYLETFEVGKNHDWAQSSGITPDGFLQLLDQCRSLRVFYFVFDTRGYIEIPQGDPWRGLRMPKHSFLHLLNSPIEEESIHALGVFFHAAPYPDFGLSTHWNYQYYQGSPRPQELHDLYYDRWVRVRDFARNLWRKRKALRYSLETRSQKQG